MNQNRPEVQECSMTNSCPYILACQAIYTRNVEDIKNLWKAIDRMKTWVIVGSASMVLSLVMTILKYVMTKI